MRLVLTVAALQLACSECNALDNGLARTPPMGYNTWYDVTGDFDEPLLLKTVDAFMALELPKYGYNYWNLDDLWSGGRYPNGSIYADPQKFPSMSLKPMCDYVHSKTLPDGSPLQCGVYSDRGTKQCGPGPGSYNHTTKDANSFAAWGADYLKEDSCSASQDHKEAFAEYGRMRDALNATGRPIVFSLCGWNPWYSNPDPELNYTGGKELANLWRIGPDDTNWNGVLANININSQLAANAGPDKGWNDPCLLLAEDLNGHLRVTQLQSRAQFSMWAVMASPLIISANIRNMSSMNVETYTNAEVIAVDQDVLGMQGERIVGGDLAATPGAGGVSDGTPIVLATCDTTADHQRWAFGGGTTPTPKGTIYSPSLKIAWNSLDCGPQVVAWQWVTNGCSGNQGFYFRPNAQHQLVSGLADPESGKEQCVIVADTVGSQLELGECPSLVKQAEDTSATFYFDEATGLIHYGSMDGDLCVSAGKEQGAPSTTNVWSRKLSGGKVAMVFINVGTTAAPNVTCDNDCIEKTGLAGKSVTVRDLWLHKDISTEPKLSELVAKDLQPEGGHQMLLLTPTTSA